MPFSSLHTIELQLVMHCCSLPALLQLARCNRSTLAAASAPFAWSVLFPSAPPIPLSADLASRLPRSLLRFTRLTLLWRLKIPFRALRSISTKIDPKSFKAAHIWVQPDIADEEIASILAALAVTLPAGGIVGLDASYRKGITPEVCARLSNSASFRRLQSVKLFTAEFKCGPFLKLFAQLTAGRVLEVVSPRSELRLSRESAADDHRWTLRASGLSLRAVAELVSDAHLPVLY